MPRRSSSRKPRSHLFASRRFSLSSLSLSLDSYTVLRRIPSFPSSPDSRTLLAAVRARTPRPALLQPPAVKQAVKPPSQAMTRVYTRQAPDVTLHASTIQAAAATLHTHPVSRGNSHTTRLGHSAIICRHQAIRDQPISALAMCSDCGSSPFVPSRHGIELRQSLALWDERHSHRAQINARSVSRRIGRSRDHKHVRARLAIVPSAQRPCPHRPSQGVTASIREHHQRMTNNSERPTSSEIDVHAVRDHRIIIGMAGTEPRSTARDA